MESLWQDLRFAFRSIRRAPAVPCLAAASLTLAIAGNTTIFSYVSAVLAPPSSFDEPERLVFLSERRQSGDRRVGTVSGPNYLDVCERQSSFEATGAMRATRFSMKVGDEAPVLVDAVKVTPGFFEMVGYRARQGRLFTSEEGVRGHQHVTILSWAGWNDLFGARPDILGETIRLGGTPHVVVGILGRNESFDLQPGTALFVPLVLDRATNGPGGLERQRRVLRALGRLRPGVSQAEAEVEVAGIMEQLAAEFPDANRGFTMDLFNLDHEYRDPMTWKLFGMLQVAVFFVLMIACVNVANLMLARGQGREREIALRLALGASRRRIACLLLTESLVIALTAGLLGALLSVPALGVLRLLSAGGFAEFQMPTIDLRALLFTFVIALLAGLAFGMAPVAQAFRLGLTAVFKDGGPVTSDGAGRQRLTKALVVLQITLALVLLAGAGVTVSSFINLHVADPGFETENLVNVELKLSETRYGDNGRVLAAIARLREQLTALDGVEEVIAGSMPARFMPIERLNFTIDAHPPTGNLAGPRGVRIVASPEIFETLGIPLIRGRGLRSSDRERVTAVAVINQEAVERFWAPDENPIGGTITVEGTSRQVVGIVADVIHGLSIRYDPVVYVPLRQAPRRELYLTLLTTPGDAVLAEVRRVIMEFDEDLATAPVERLDDFLFGIYSMPDILATCLSALALLTLILAVLGTYGVLAYSVSRRRHEIGVRVAIGASPGRVVAMVFRQGGSLAAFGFLLGAPLVYRVVRFLEGMYSPFMPVQHGMVLVMAAVLALAAAAAALIPARRAAAVDPLEALRCE